MGGLQTMHYNLFTYPPGNNTIFMFIPLTSQLNLFDYTIKAITIQALIKSERTYS